MQTRQKKENVQFFILVVVVPPLYSAGRSRSLARYFSNSKQILAETIS